MQRHYHIRWESSKSCLPPFRVLAPHPHVACVDRQLRTLRLFPPRASGMCVPVTDMQGGLTILGRPHGALSLSSPMVDIEGSPGFSFQEPWLGPVPRRSEAGGLGRGHCPTVLPWTQSASPGNQVGPALTMLLGNHWLRPGDKTPPTPAKETGSA